MAQAGVQRVQGPEKRGRFEVWPEQVISNADWLALPKAPTGYLEVVRTNGLTDAPRGSSAKGSRSDAPKVSSAQQAIDVSTAASSAAMAVLLTSTSHPEAAQSVARQYSAALQALDALRGSLLGMGRSMGVEGGASSSSGASAVSSDQTTIHREDAHDGYLAHQSAPVSPPAFMHQSSLSSMRDGTPPQSLAGLGLGLGQGLARTLSTLSQGTVASALADVQTGGDASAAAGGSGRAGTGSGLGGSATPVVQTGAGGGSEIDRLKADLEALRQAKTKLVQENKVLQEKLEKTGNELTVTQQKLRRIGVQT